MLKGERGQQAPISVEIKEIEVSKRVYNLILTPMCMTSLE
jgi:hypothetical protein